MSENTLKVCLLALMGVTVVALSTLIGLGHNSGIQDALLVIVGGTGVLGVWERLKR